MIQGDINYIVSGADLIVLELTLSSVHQGRIQRGFIGVARTTVGKNYFIFMGNLVKIYKFHGFLLKVVQTWSTLSIEF